MKTKLLLMGIIFTILSGVVLENRAQAQDTVSIDLFYQELSPYGEWSPHIEFGYIWQPYEVGPEWKPYTGGRWEWSDQGWIWISYEPWGWATYHYGRWVYDDYQGWIWIPGTTWAPAWVSWHQSPEYIGWAPLPPDRGFFIEIGFVFNSYNTYGHNYHHNKHRYYHDYYYNQHNYRPPARHCVFLPTHSFGHHKHAGKAAIPDPQYTVVLRNSKNITNIKYAGNKVMNYGPDRYYIEKRSNRKIVEYNIVDRDNVVLRGNKNVNAVKGNTYNVYRPKIERNPFIKTKSNGTFERSNQVKKENIGKPTYHNYGQFNKTDVKTDFSGKRDFQNGKYNASKNPAVTNRAVVPNKIGSRSNSNITNEKVYKRDNQRNTNNQAYKTPPNSNGRNNYSRELKQQKNSVPTQPGNKLRTVNAQDNKFSKNKPSAGNKNTQAVKSYSKTTYGYKNGSVNKSNQKSDKSNYSSKNKGSDAAKGNVPQRPYNPTTKTPPSSNRSTFSKR
jgi:hypothetical protein